MKWVRAFRGFIFYLCIVFAWLLAAYIYVEQTPKIFEVKSLVMFNRPAVALPEYLGEVGSNRWIWVRNGLATKEVLITDELLRQIISTEKILQDRLTSFETAAKIKGLQRTEAAYINEMRKNVAINFTGADVYSFWIGVKDEDAFLATRMNRMILDRLIEIEVKKPIEAYQTAISHLEQRLARLKAREKSTSPNLEENRRLLLSLGREIERIEATSQHLHIAIMLMDAEKKAQFSIIVEPSPEVDAIWPQPTFTYLIACGIGLFCVTLSIYVKMLVQRQRSERLLSV